MLLRAARRHVLMKILNTLFVDAVAAASADDDSD